MNLKTYQALPREERFAAYLKALRPLHAAGRARLLKAFGLASLSQKWSLAPHLTASPMASLESHTLEATPTAWLFQEDFSLFYVSHEDAEFLHLRRADVDYTTTRSHEAPTYRVARRCLHEPMGAFLKSISQDAEATKRRRRLIVAFRGPQEVLALEHSAAALRKARREAAAAGWLPLAPWEEALLEASAKRRGEGSHGRA